MAQETTPSTQHREALVAKLRRFGARPKDESSRGFIDTYIDLCNEAAAALAPPPEAERVEIPAVEVYGPLHVLPCAATAEQRAFVRASGLYSMGDALLMWVNDGDLDMLLFTPRTTNDLPATPAEQPDQRAGEVPVTADERAQWKALLNAMLAQVQALGGDMVTALRDAAVEAQSVLHPSQESQTAEVEAMREALNAIVDRGPERNSKWAGMTARDIALVGLRALPIPSTPVGEAGEGVAS